MRRFPIVALIVVLAAAVVALLLLEPDWSPLSPSASPEAGSSRRTDVVGGPAQQAAASEEADDDPDATLTTMTLAGGDVSLSYPEEFGLAVNQDQLLVSSYIPVCDQGFDYCLYLNSSEFDGTNFDGAGLRIDVRDDLEYEAACMLEQPAGYSDLTPIVDGSGDHTTALFGNVGQGAAGHFTKGAIYRLQYEGNCYEFETRIAQTQFGNYPEGEVERFSEAAQDGLSARLTGILNRVSLPDGRERLWTSEREPETMAPAEQIRITSPAPEAVVSSPLELSGEALGTWFFEGSFPFRLQSHDGDVLASGTVTTDGNWMTTDFVGFFATVDFDVEAQVPGTLILMKDNPSGLPANAASVEVPLTLQP